MILYFRKMSVAAAFIFLVATNIALMPAKAESQEVKEKPRLYTYVAVWSFPRSEWSAFAAPNTAADDLITKTLASGKLVGIGVANSLMHHADGITHMNWWSSMTEAGLFNYLDQESGLPPDPALAKATKHADYIVASTHYNRKAATVKAGYQMVSYLRLKDDAPEKAVSLIAKTIVTPVMEKLFSDGAIVEYQLSTEDFQSGPARGFWIEWIATNAEAFDKVSAAWRDAAGKNPIFDATNGFIDWDAARDYVYHVDATLK